MAPKPQTLRGFNQPDPKRIADDLSRRYQAMNRAALRYASAEVLPAAEAKDRGQLAAALKGVQ